MANNFLSIGHNDLRLITNIIHRMMKKNKYKNSQSNYKKMGKFTKIELPTDLKTYNVLHLKTQKKKYKTFIIKSIIK